MPIILLLVIQGYVQNYVTHGQRLIDQSVYVILMLESEQKVNLSIFLCGNCYVKKKVFAQFG